MRRIIENICKKKSFFPYALGSFAFFSLTGLIFYNFLDQIFNFLNIIAICSTIIGVILDIPKLKIENRKNINKFWAIGVGFIVAYSLIPSIHGFIINQYESPQQSPEPTISSTPEDNNQLGEEEIMRNEEEIQDSNNEDKESEKLLENNPSSSTAESKNDTKNSDSKDEFDSGQELILPDGPEIKSDETFNPEDGGASLFDTMDDELLKLEYEQNGENKESIKYNIKYYLGIKMNSQSQPDNKVINGDPEFTKLTKQANIIQEDIENNGRDLEKIQKIITLREKALDLYVTKSLCKSLASSYCELAELHRADKDWEMAYESYVKSIEYETTHIKLVRNINDYYNSINRMAIAYQAIGEISALSNDVKKTAYYISACLYEIAYEYAIGESDEEMSFYSSYYAGLTNHTLMGLSKNMGERDYNYYIVDALSYYEKSLDYTNNENQIDNLCNFIIQICNNAIDYIRHYGNPGNMLKRDEYLQKAEIYNSIKSTLADG